MIRVIVQAEDFDLGAEYQRLRTWSDAVGALVTFTGLVRDLPGQSLHTLSLEHYPGMTEKSLQAIVDTACAKWPLSAVTVIHRFGDLTLNDQIVFVGVACAHRAQAFEAATFLMDRLKTEAPFWKKEQTADGSQWVEAKTADQVRAKKWVGHRHD